MEMAQTERAEFGPSPSLCSGVCCWHQTSGRYGELSLVSPRTLTWASDSVFVCVKAVHVSWATGYSEHWGVSAIVSGTTFHVEASGRLDYFRRVVWRHFMVLLCFFAFCCFLGFFLRLNPTHHSLNCLGDDCDAFFLWNYSRVCALKNFTWPSISIRVRR